LTISEQMVGQASKVRLRSVFLWNVDVLLNNLLVFLIKFVPFCRFIALV